MGVLAEGGSLQQNRQSSEISDEDPLFRAILGEAMDAELGHAGSDVHFACGTLLRSAYNASVATDAAKAWRQMTSLWIENKLSSGFMHSNGCFNAK
jgi:hypothetical protein